MEQRPDTEFRRRVPRIATTSWSGRYIVEDDPTSEWSESSVLDISVLGVGLELLPIDDTDDLDQLVGHRLVVLVQAPVGESISVRLMGTVKNVGRGTEGACGLVWSSSDSLTLSRRSSRSSSSCRWPGDRRSCNSD